MSVLLRRKRMTTAYILDAVRTPRGRGKPGKGALTGIHPQELLAQTLNQLAERTGIDKYDVEDVVAGCVTQVHEQGADIARNAVLAADWPIEVTGVALNRFCGSGLQAVNFAAMSVMTGMQHLVIGGGVESMSRVPMGSDAADVDGKSLQLRKRLFQVPHGLGAHLIASLEGFSRPDFDGFALESQQCAAQAQQETRFKQSLFAVRDPETGQVVLESDEYPRSNTTLEGLALLEPAFAALGAVPAGFHGETVDQIALRHYPQVNEICHVHTAGNSSGIVDGAAAVLLASEEYVRTHGLKPRARVRAMATAGSDPILMLTAPTPASRKALALARMTPHDIDLWEINQAFAVVPLQVIRNLEIEREKVNVSGGVLVLGRPSGGSGAMVFGEMLDALYPRKLSTTLITLCFLGGM